MSLSWLDAVVATPTLGMRLVPRLQAFAGLHDRLAPLVDTLDNATLKADGPWSLSIETGGFEYSIAPANVVVSFAYRHRLVKSPGALPTVATPDVRPFSRLLEDARERLLAIAGVLASDGISLLANRFGIVATCVLDAAHLPPGVSQLREDLGRSWRTVDRCEATLVARVREDPEFQDKCHHMMAFDVALSEVSVTLDYQRYFASPLRLTCRDDLGRVVATWLESALDYLQRFGEGDYGNQGGA